MAESANVGRAHGILPATLRRPRHEERGQVKAQHPKAEAHYQDAYKWLAMFVDGRPHIIGCGPSGTRFSEPLAYGNTRSNARVNVRKKLEAVQGIKTL